MAIRTVQPDGSGNYGMEVTFTKIKIIFAEATSIFAGKMDKQLDLDDYNAVKAYYGIKD